MRARAFYRTEPASTCSRRRTTAAARNPASIRFRPVQGKKAYQRLQMEIEQYTCDAIRPANLAQHGAEPGQGSDWLAPSESGEYWGFGLTAPCPLVGCQQQLHKDPVFPKLGRDLALGVGLDLLKTHRMVQRMGGPMNLSTHTIRRRLIAVSCVRGCVRRDTSMRRPSTPSITS